MFDCLVSLGSNLGDRRATIEEAVNLLEKTDAIESLSVSTLIETPPIDGQTQVEGKVTSKQGAFLNGVVRFSTDLSANELHDRLREIEQLLGRERHQRWSARTLDLDLLGYGNQILGDPRLRVPHPRMSFRPFVLEPACEIAADWVHPEFDVSLGTLFETLQHGMNEVHVIGEIAPLIQAEVDILDLSVLAVRQEAEQLVGASYAPRLVIDARPSVCFDGVVTSPRLRLADCHPGSWRTEVRAALQCVWPNG